MPDRGTPTTPPGPLSDERRAAIIRLLETSNDNLPLPVRREHSASGFTHKPSSRTCPDCLANGRPIIGCETCGGRGVVPISRLGSIAAPDALPDDGEARDPYAKTETVQPFGFSDEEKLDAKDRLVMLDNAIREASRALDAMLPASEADLLERANREPYAWEMERSRMFRDFDYGPLFVALEQLRQVDGTAYTLLHSVYVYGWQQQPSTTVEAILERGLVFLDERLPAPLRAPDPEPERRVVAKVERGAGDIARATRDERIRQMAAEGAKPAEIAAACHVSIRTVYNVVREAA